jgi:hypothetical protein
MRGIGQMKETKKMNMFYILSIKKEYRILKPAKTTKERD